MRCKDVIIHLLTSMFLVTGANLQLNAQAKTSSLSLEDIRQWRTHSITLSDDGQWYTVLYSLEDEPESRMDTLAGDRIKAYFDEDNQTDVLYLCHAKEGIRYRIADGSKPKFSPASDWVAYQIKPDQEEADENEEKKENLIIELKHLNSGFTVTYESSASYEFAEDKNYFLTRDTSSLLIYDLENRREHFIGSVGEYVVDKKTDHIVYTISTADNRGNGVYLFNPIDRTTKALETGSYSFSNLAWNTDRNSLAGYRYQKKGEKIDPATLTLLVITGIEDETPQSVEYPMAEMGEMPENMMLAVKTEESSNELKWSPEGAGLFLKVKAIEEDKSQGSETDTSEMAPSVQVWHWKDKKLLSERIMDHERQQEVVFEAMFDLASNSVIQPTDNENQTLHYSPGTGTWGILQDFSNYLSDWDVPKSDLYRISLKTGERKLIQEKHSGSWYSKNFDISPNGEKMVYWDGNHYWSYDFREDTKQNMTAHLPISFVDKNYDRYGYSPAYGFVGWIKGQDAVLVADEFDLWVLPLDKNTAAKNLTASGASEDSVRFRLEDDRFRDEPEIEDRYIDLSTPVILNVFNTRTKYAGFYQLNEGKLTELIYQPASFAKPWSRQELIKSKDAKTVIYHRGDYQTYPEAYLSELDLSSAKKITRTNPQQETFTWGSRVLIDYTNDDGVPLQAVLSIPEEYKKGEKLPMVVYSYEKMSYTMYSYPMPYVNGATMPEMYLVSDGYLFLRPDIHFNVGTPHSDMHECIDAAIEKVIELGYVDEARIGYQGFSFGGHCGMYISTQENKFAAIAAGAGVSNLVQGFNIDIVRDGSNEQDYYMTSQGRLGTDPTSDTEMYIRESPVFQAQGMNTPLLLYHGTADKVVQWEHSFGFYSILRYLKKPVVFLSYRGEGHGLRKEENRLDLQIRLKAYFDHYLKGAEAKDWMIEEIPYTPEESSETEENDKRTLPKWK
jgi:dipeptidyl aminopeptidase/acylaminoacyl peptidase